MKRKEGKWGIQKERKTRKEGQKKERGNKGENEGLINGRKAKQLSKEGGVNGNARKIGKEAQQRRK